ncbi:MAG: 2-hydroxyacid dehydrogenase [Acidobacteriota bacterium]|nr:2-hydroxyacid dehydrogenase [Blastocatellia bacterium]MDW8238236.1 2-hydroxyacid dehydrogenase [Acidobacteriota bacterium]
MTNQATAHIVVLSPVPAALVQQWLVAQSGRFDLIVTSAEGATDEQLNNALQQADMLLGDYTFRHAITEQFLSRTPKLRFIQQPSVGYEHIDLKACRQRGVTVANTPGVNDVAVAEHTLMLALALLKKAIYAHQRTSEGQWVQRELMWERGIFELQGKTYGIIGMGRIGREVARRLNAFGTQTLYYDPVRLPADEEADLKVQYRALDDLLRVADIVSLHVPLTEQTRGMIGQRELSLMKFSAVFINVARGECVDELALAERLRQKKLAGAGVDVFSQEPIAADHPLLRLENVILTPHIAGATAEVRQRVVQMAVGNLVRVLKGEEPLYVVNPRT